MDMDDAIVTLGFPEDFIETYQIISFLGCGGSGLVLKVNSLLSNEVYAAKIQRRDQPGNLEPKEVTVMKTLVSAGISRVPRVVDLVRNTEWDVIVTELRGHPWYLEGLDLSRRPAGFPAAVFRQLLRSLPREPARDLFAFISRAVGREGRGLEVRVASRIMAQIVETHARMFALGMLHGDIKAENYLIDEDGGVVVVDYSSVSRVGLVGQDKTGTPGHQSPQMSQGISTFDGSDEVWSLGVLLFEMLVGAAPGFMEGFTLSTPSLYLFDRIVNEPSARNVVLQTLQPERRMSFQDLRNHTFLRLHEE